jgi:uncharacterized membrane protein YphA (DoxX/SURF4 family)
VNVVLWIIQILLALAFLAAGLAKVSQPKKKLAGHMAWVDDFSERSVKLIGAAEVLGALGLVLPAAGITGALIPIAATGLVLLMLGAAITHARRGEMQMIAVNLVLLVLAAVVAWGRFGPYEL